jgi:hypothetical protein
MPIHDPRFGPVEQAHLFVAVLGASSYTYREKAVAVDLHHLLAILDLRASIATTGPKI